MTLHHMLHATGGHSSTTRAPFCRHFDPSNGRPLRRLHPNLPCNGCRWSHGGRHGGRSPLFGRGILAGFAWSPFAPCMNVVERVEIAAVDRRHGVPVFQIKDAVGFRILAHKRQTSGIHSSGRLTRIPIERRRRKGALRAQARSDARLHAPRGLGQTSVYMTALHPDRGRSLKKDESFIRVVYRNAYKGDGGSTYTHTTQERRDTSPTQDTFSGQLRRGLPRLH